MHLKHASLFAGAAAIITTGGVFADDTQEARIRQLEEQVRQLKASQNDNWLTEQRATEIRGIVQDVLADVDMRASMLQGGGGAGYNNGFNVVSGDGNFSLTINGHIQARFLYNDGQDEDNNEGGGASTDERYGFDIPRARLAFGGYVMDPSWQYYLRMEGDFGGDDGPPPSSNDEDYDMLEAYITKTMDNGMDVTFGQFKLPFLTEFTTDASDQLASERSIASYAMNTGWSQGIMVSSEQDTWRWSGAFSDGGQAMDSRWDNTDTDWALTGAVDILLNGSFDQFDDGFHSRPGSESGQMVHLALHAEEGDSEFGPDYDAFSLTADIQVEGDGWSAFGALMYADIDGVFSDDYFGFVGQGEYFFNDNTAVFGRYEFLEGGSGDEDLSILTLGVNKFYGDNVRATIDLMYGLEEVDSSHDLLGPASSDIRKAGFFFDNGGQDGQWALRTQLELTF